MKTQHLRARGQCLLLSKHHGRQVFQLGFEFLLGMFQSMNGSKQAIEIMLML